MTTFKHKISDLAFEVEGVLSDIQELHETMAEMQAYLVNLMESDIPEQYEIEEAELRGAMWVIQRLMPLKSVDEKTCRAIASEICDSSRESELFE